MITTTLSTTSHDSSALSLELFIWQTLQIVWDKPVQLGCAAVMCRAWYRTINNYIIYITLCNNTKIMTIWLTSIGPCLKLVSKLWSCNYSGESFDNISAIINSYKKHKKYLFEFPNDQQAQRKSAVCVHIEFMNSLKCIFILVFFLVFVNFCIQFYS